MAEAFRISKRHRHGIVLEGKYNRNELIAFQEEHPKRNVLYIGKNAKVKGFCNSLPNSITSVVFNFKHKEFKDKKEEEKWIRSTYFDD